MDLPNYLLERVFLYLSWNDRSRAARVCRKWLEVFHSPSLWRTMVVRPPTRSLSRVQYDMRAYYLSWTIGWYVKTYRFLPTEDIFLLNRSLSIIARFFECNSASVGGITESDDPEKDEFDKSNEHYELPDENELIYDVHDGGSAGQSGEPRLCDYFGTIQGDPDAEATLRMILKMQAREYLGISSESDDDESWSSEADLPDQFIRHYGSLPTAQLSSPIAPLGLQRPLHRSVSYRRPQHQRRVNPPAVACFSLDFYCEVDESRRHVYGTGGALLSTIQRVVKQLTCLQCLRLTSLFLIPSDARRLLADVASVASTSLTDLDLTHLSKPLSEAELAHSAGRVQALDSSGLSLPTGGNKDWYLLDPRWLDARPHPSRGNPLAELPALFPHLTRLTLAVTQLTGPMLLRLLHQTCLREICLNQTELTAFTLPGEGTQSEDSGGFHPIIPHPGSDDITDEYGHYDDSSVTPIDLNGDVIDWGGDVPLFIPGYSSSSEKSPMHRLSQRRPIAVNSSLVGWRPITLTEWSTALVLRPSLSVTFCLVSAGRVLQVHEVSRPDLCPQPPAPVRTVVVATQMGVSNAMQLAFQLNCPVNLSSYRDTLTRLVLSIQTASPAPTNRCSVDLNDAIFKTCASCHLLRLLAFGGNTDYLHITTIFNICRLHERRVSRSGVGNTCRQEGSTAYRLVVEANCCSLSGDGRSGALISGKGNPDCLSATTSTWCAMVFEAGPTTEARLAAAERCISTALGQPHWKFITASQFQSHLSNWLPTI